MSMKAGQRKTKKSAIAFATIVKAYANGANDREAAIAGGITTSTLYNWIRSDDTFKDETIAAKLKFDNDVADEAIISLEQCKNLAENYVIRLLKGDVYKTKTHSSADGTILWQDSESVLPSDKVLERFLPAIANSDVTFTLNVGKATPTFAVDDDEEFSTEFLTEFL